MVNYYVHCHRESSYVAVAGINDVQANTTQTLRNEGMKMPLQQYEENAYTKA